MSTFQGSLCISYHICKVENLKEKYYAHLTDWWGIQEQFLAQEHIKQRENQL